MASLRRAGQAHSAVVRAPRDWNSVTDRVNAAATRSSSVARAKWSRPQSRNIFDAAGCDRVAVSPGLRRRRLPGRRVSVWSAGRGRPGLLKPPGTHRDQWGHGYGRAIALAAAALRDLGASTALGVTSASNRGGVPTYEPGYRRMPDAIDFAKDRWS